jgi:hypothetical protein
MSCGRHLFHVSAPSFRIARRSGFAIGSTACQTELAEIAAGRQAQEGRQLNPPNDSVASLAFARGFVVPEETEQNSRHNEDQYKCARIDPPPPYTAGIWFVRDIEAFIPLVSISCNSDQPFFHTQALCSYARSIVAPTGRPRATRKITDLIP